MTLVYLMTMSSYGFVDAVTIQSYVDSYTEAYFTNHLFKRTADGPSDILCTFLQTVLFSWSGDLCVDSTVVFKNETEQQTIVTMW